MGHSDLDPAVHERRPGNAGQNVGPKLADLSLDDLLTSRQSGAVQNLKDRRFDLYRVA